MVEHERITDSAELDAIATAINEIARVDAPLRSAQCEARNNGRQCPHTAVNLVRMHRWGECEDPPDDGADAAWLDPDGNVVALMCAPCAGQALVSGWRAIRDLQARIPASLWPIHCPQCNRPTNRGGDLVQIEEIPR